MDESRVVEHSADDKVVAVARVEPGRVLIKPISQAALRIRRGDREGIFEQVVDIVLHWVQGRVGRPLPDTARQRQKFETSDIGAQHAAAVAIDDPTVWALRIDDADKTVALRTWITEACVGVDPSGDVLVGVRLTCTMRGEILPIDRTVPWFLRSIVAIGEVELDGRPINSEPWVVRSADDVDSLVDLLEQRTRGHSVVVLSTRDDSDDETTTAIPASAVLSRVMGAAHVVIVTASAARLLTDVVGREMSVFRQAVRIYRPGFHRISDKPWRHLLYPAIRITEWPQEGDSDFVTWITSRTLEDSVHGAARREELVPSFNTVRQAAAKLERENSRSLGASSDELLRLFESDNEQLRAEIQSQRDEFSSLLVEGERERDNAIGEARAARAQIAALQARISSLATRAGSSPADGEALPNDLEQFEFWCQKYLPGFVEVHSRAINGVKKSVYRDPTLIYRALLLLRDYYVPMRREGGRELVDKFEAACRELGLENSLVGEATKRFSDEYTVRWNGEPHILDWHLKAGDARERTKCFRLYYFWDDDTGYVVVGSMPAHLKNDLT